MLIASGIVSDEYGERVAYTVPTNDVTHIVTAHQFPVFVSVAIDTLHQKLGISMPVLMGALADLEFEGIINKLPGARYEKT